MTGSVRGDGNMAELHAAENIAAEPSLFRAYFLGALAGALSDQPEIWDGAIATAINCDQRAAARQASVTE